MNNSLRKWIRGAIELLIYGIASALVAGFIAWKTDMSWAEWRGLIIASFMTNGGLRFVQYFVTHPIPLSEDTGMTRPDGSSITIPGPVLSLNPLAKVQPALPPPADPAASNPMERGLKP